MRSALTLPASLYVDPAVFARELETIFSRNWVLFGATQGRLDVPGSAWAQTVLPQRPLVATRATGPGAEARVWHNVCRHRAGPLVLDTHTQRNTRDLLTCRYHRWCYSAQTGKLVSAPHFGEAVDKNEFALRGVECAETAGLLFVRLTEGGPPLEASFGDAFARLAKWPLREYELHGTRTHSLRCNWKTYVENYSEGYHIPAVHASLNATIDMSSYRVIPYPEANYAEHIVTPLAGADTAYEGMWFFMWPNLAINVYRTGVTVEQIVPISVNETQIWYTDLVHKNATAEEREDSIKWSTTVTLEDVSICEAVQRGLESGQYDRGRLSPLHEGGVQWFQHKVSQALQ